MPDEQDREHLPEMTGSEPLPACPIDVEARLDTERVLGSFAPRTPRFKRERLLVLVKNVRNAAFAAAPAVRSRTPWYWPAATAAMGATSLCLAVLLVVRGAAEPVIRVEYKDRIVYQTITVPAEETEADVDSEAPDETFVEAAAAAEVSAPSFPADNYLHTRSIALTQGVDAMAFTQPMGKGGAAPPPATRNELLRQLAPAASLRPAVTSPSWVGWPSW